MPDQDLVPLFLHECQRRLFDDEWPRLKKALGKLSVEEIWRRPNEQTISVGNIILHLCGNVRQRIMASIGGEPDVRDRPREFSERGPMRTEDLVAKLDTTMEEARVIISGVTLEELLRRRQVQNDEETGLGLLIRVVEHFGYHTGQVVYATKSMKAVDLGFFPNLR